MSHRVLSPLEIARTYKQVEIAGKDHQEILITLYEALIAHIRRASRALQNKDVVAKGKAVGTALDLLGELRQTLDFERAMRLATELDHFYVRSTQELLQAHRRDDLISFHDMEQKFVEILGAWKEVVH